MKIAVVIPSMRGPKSLENFLEIAPDNVDFIIISQEKIKRRYERTIEFNDKEVFAKSWIFNRVTKRNFGFLYAYKQNYDAVISLDDDCFPTSQTYFQEHQERLQSYGNDYFNVLNAYENIPTDVLERGARGYPTDNLKKFPIVINQGLWVGDIDLPSRTISEILDSKDGKIPPIISARSNVTKDFVIPRYQLTTFGGMNTSFLAEVVPAIPWAYQEPDGSGIYRYDDIWAGLFVKIILDKLEKRMSVGHPVVLHEKGKRDMQKDLDYERKGEEMNNFLWQKLQDLILEGKDYVTCFLEIANWLKTVSDKPERTFFKKISESMYEWINLIENKI